MIHTRSISHPMPTESLVCASGPRPDTMIMAESGTAPSSGRTIPPGEKNIFTLLYYYYILFNVTCAMRVM